MSLKSLQAFALGAAVLGGATLTARVPPSETTPGQGEGLSVEAGT